MKTLFTFSVVFLIHISLNAQCNDLFFSEYLEGSSNNKAIEIYNPTCNAIDLSGYSIERFNNGAVSPTYTQSFPAGTMIASKGVYVIGNASADPIILGVSDTTSAATFYNGDDALTLMNLSTGDTLDIIGIVGVDPGTNWTVGTGATSEYTLVRMSTIHQGTTDWAAGATQWDVFPQNTFDSLGTHYMTDCSFPLNASMTVDNNPACLTACFNSTSQSSTCSISSYFYDFGDGNISTQPNPCHTYPAPGVYTVCLTVVDGVAADSMCMTVTIDTYDDASITSTGPYCASDSAVTLTAMTGGGVWSGTGITDSLNGVFDPSAAGQGTFLIYYAIDGTCFSEDSVLLTVNNPSVVFGPLTYVCEGSSPITLTEGTPSGGTYSGPGVSGGVFDPVAVGVGTYTLTYTYTDGNGCTASDTSSIDVAPCVGLQELAEGDVLIQPNPVDDKLVITTNAVIQNVQIIDLSGVVQLETKDAEINVSHLSKGTYVVKVYTNKGETSQRIVKE